MCPTILIVDDHDAVRTSLRDWFGTVFPDCTLAEASSGEEAVELALARPPDVILMDIGLPQMNGIEAARRIKAAAPQVQVVMLTIHEAPEYQADAAAAGVTAYVLKRQMYRELIPTLQRLLPSTNRHN
ncbi:MAG: response regulator transcription factor [Anaerolineae bacterium]|nr:response regulator transcription factor [Anaerolineae bacterium]